MTIRANEKNSAVPIHNRTNRHRNHPKYWMSGEHHFNSLQEELPTAILRVESNHLRITLRAVSFSNKHVASSLLGGSRLSPWPNIVQFLLLLDPSLFE
jgi:hypothetical protein